MMQLTETMTETEKCPVMIVISWYCGSRSSKQLAIFTAFFCVKPSATIKELR